MRPSPRSRPGTFCTLGGWLCGRPQRKVGKEAVREPLQARANQKVVDLVGDSPDHLADALVDGHALRSDGVRLPKGLAILVQSILEFGRWAFGSDNIFFFRKGGMALPLTLDTAVRTPPGLTTVTAMGRHSSSSSILMVLA